MASGPPKTFEALVAIVIPPACREEVMGDLHERYRSTAQYGLDAARTVPLVVLSRIHRTADSRALLIQAFAFYASFLAAAWIDGLALLRDQWGLLRLAVPAAGAMVGVMLGDAYANPRLRRPLKLTLAPVQGAGLAVASQELMWLFSPDFAVPRSVLFSGCAAGLLLSSAVRMVFAPAIRQKDRKNKDQTMRSKRTMAIIGATLLAVAVAAVIWVAAENGSTGAKLTYSQFLASVESGQIASVTITGSNSGAARATGRRTDGSTIRTILPLDYGDALRVMQEKQVSVEIRDWTSDPLRLLLNATPFLVLLAFWFFMYQKVRNDQRRGLSR
jgi:hypothetical protein